MGRRNKDNHPYLVFRSDSGAPTYYRVFPERLRPHLKGQVVGHKGKALAVKADQPSIRVALPNGCEKDRLDGWTRVHDQVEDIVRQASATLMKLSKALVAVNAIAPEQHLQMLDQLRHGILAADDRSRTRPNELSDTAAVMKAVLEKAKRPVSSVRDLQRTAQDVARREAGRDVRADDPQILDRDGEEGEVNVDPHTLDMLKRLSRICDPKGIKLDPEMNELLNGKLSRGGAIASDVTALLARNGMTLPEGHEDRLQLALDIPRVQADAHAVVEARRNGGTTLTPPRPAPIQLPAPPSPTLSAMRAKWKQLAKPGEKACNDNKLYTDAFIGQFGDLPVSEITRAQVREFRDLLAKRPRNLPRDLRKLPLRTQVAVAATMPECRLLTPHTVNAKGVGSLSVIMEVAIAEDVITANPCAGQLLRTKGKACERLPYSSDDINRLAASPVFADGRRFKAGAGEAAFWMPLIGMFEGARLEEIGQLLIVDVRQEDGIWYFYFMDLDDGQAASTSDKERKQLKTAAARRVVPIHPFLLRIGFLGYVAWLRGRDETRLFPELKLYRGRRTKEWSKWWGRYTDEYVTDSPHKVFHSFRHGFIDRLRNITGSEDAGMALAGHAQHMYGKTISLQTRHRIICKLTYPGVDLRLFEEAATKLSYVRSRPAAGTVSPRKASHRLAAGKSAVATARVQP